MNISQQSKCSERGITLSGHSEMHMPCKLQGA